MIVGGIYRDENDRILIILDKQIMYKFEYTTIYLYRKYTINSGICFQTNKEVNNYLKSVFIETRRIISSDFNTEAHDDTENVNFSYLGNVNEGLLNIMLEEMVECIKD